ncbi:site-specific integrase [Vibrio parahaemolyticus]|uniref:tyrosine-type recombinase/integrase n=2 Tax=Vibrio TaxID=662 RepID=UPI001A2EBC8C|nr:site-specific integrase [Vibrio intestinalis]EJB8582524.1 site-specific integrase [Vibrio parahaemolyticus]HAS6292523.1 tyrosine-type recombinase/integrase [Vibrio vulnificus]HAS6314611.1 tyrosine-type recombinase/integrase [Vibrio vulnificus]HDY7554721.1 site-specific integrase [Vibrio vulnificus]HDY7576000.1 site-specific integrase [Vibrio vulnificus]
MIEKPDYSMYFKIGKGLAIYRQKHSQSYYVRLRIDKKNVQRSLKTTNRDEALRKAIRFEDEMKKRQFAGLPIIETKSMTIKKAFEGAIALLDAKDVQKTIYTSYKTLINKHIIPYFKCKSIEELTAKNIRLYYESRELSLTRKRMTNTCFMLMFQYLEEEDYIKKSEIPSLPKSESKKVENRVAFTNLDLAAIQESFDEFALNGRTDKTKEYRKTLKHYFNLLVETGIRAGEEAGFMFSNVIKDEIDGEIHHFITIEKGKTKGYSRSRKIPLSKSAVNSLVEMAKIQNPSENITEKNFVFVRKPILESSYDTKGDFVKMFKTLIDSLIADKKVSQPYTLYSCRHYFITKRLSQDVDIYLLSKFVGNSPDMIRLHYDHAAQMMKVDNIDTMTFRDRENEEFLSQMEQREQELDVINPNRHKELSEALQKEQEEKEMKELLDSFDLSDDEYFVPMTFDD